MEVLLAGAGPAQLVETLAAPGSGVMGLIWE